MVRDAVSSEPVSALNSLVAGKFARKFDLMCPGGVERNVKTRGFARLRMKFPRARSREIIPP